MKKFFTFIPAVLMSMSVLAEGYQVNLMSAKQTGMGHVGVAMKLGAESMHFNPAGMASMPGQINVSAGVSGVISEASYTNNGYKATTDNEVSTPFYLYAGFQIYKNLKVGVGLNTPYGNGLRWPNDWKGATLIQEIKLKAFNLQPTLAWQINEHVAVGAGLMMYFGNFTLQRALSAPGALSPVLGAEYDNVVPVWAKLTGDASLRAGYHVGILWDINPRWRVGASLRSKVLMKVKEGVADVSYASELAKATLQQLAAAGHVPPIPPLNEGTFKTQLPMPANLTVGTSFRPNPRLELALDLQMVDWSAYEELNVEFSENVLNGYCIRAVKNYRNSYAVRLGGQYTLTQRLDLRAGVYYDKSPIRETNYNPETPGMDKIGTSIGCSFSPMKGFKLDFSALYIVGLSRNGSYTYSNPGTTDTSVFSGRYRSSAFVPSLGMSYQF